MEAASQLVMFVYVYLLQVDNHTVIFKTVQDI